MLQVANVATSRSVSGDIVKKLLHWPTFVICLVIALAVGYGASNWFNLNFWLAFGITVMIWTEDCELIERLYPNYVIKELDGGHWIHSEKPAEFVEIVEDFLDPA